jgi:hypothetical protein
VVFERVIWRGGIVKASETKPDHPQQKHLLLTPIMSFQAGIARG